MEQIGGEMLRTIIRVIGVTILVGIIVEGCAGAPPTGSSQGAGPATSEAVTPDRPSSMPSPQPTLTSRPTIVPTFAPILFEDLIRLNGGCDLPCFYSEALVPGETTEDESKAFLAAFFSDLDAGVAFDTVPTGQPPIEDSYEVQLQLTHEEGHLQKIEMMGGSFAYLNVPRFNDDWHAQYGWDRVLTRNGVPSEINALFYSTFDIDHPAFYDLYLAYGELGMVIGYRGPIEETGPGQYRACLEYDAVIFIDLILTPASPDEHLSIMPTAMPSAQERPPMVDLTGMSNEEFYETFKTEGAVKCIDAIYPSR